VVKNSHSLQLTVLISLVLKNLFYSYGLTGFQTLGLYKINLEEKGEGAISQ
jgi:hypothetical protein